MPLTVKRTNVYEYTAVSQTYSEWCTIFGVNFLISRPI